MPDYVPQGRGVATPRGHEGADLSSLKITVATVLLVILLVVAHFSSKALLRAFATRGTAPGGASGLAPLVVGSQIPPAPRLQADPKDEWDRLKAGQKRWLDSYGWNDSGHTAAHIPIEQAKTLLLQRGLTHVGARPAPSPEPPREEGADGR